MALVVLSGMSAASGGAAEQVVVPEEHKRFLGVTKWYVTYTAVSAGNWSRSSGLGDSSSRGTVSHTLRGAFVADVQVPDPFLMGALVKAFGGIKEVQWSTRPASPGGSPARVHVTASNTIERYGGPTTEGYDVVGDHGGRTSTAATGQGFAAAQGAGALKIDLVQGTYALTLPWQMIRGSDRERSASKFTDSYGFDLQPRPGYKYSSSNTKQGVEELGGPVLQSLPPQRLPSGGLELSGSIRLAGKYNGAFEGERDRVATYVVWTCSPEPPADVELQVIPDQYTTWRPGGELGARVVEEGRPIPGSAFKVRLDLVDPRTGGPARIGVARIEAELKDVSAQPGVCINAPQDPISPADPDLKISPRYLWEPSDSGAKGALRPGRMPARLEIDCFDYGAWGELEVRAILVDGREVKGRLFGQRGAETVRIPKRTGNSKIADGWKETWQVTGSADNADDENEPVGDGTGGDGLTLYEEYRGFSALGRWWHGFPRTKELFVCSFVDPRLAGVGRLRLDRASGLESHRLLPAEISADRVVNFNGRSGPHAGLQRAIVLRPGPGRAVSVVGNVGTPKDIVEIRVGTQLVADLALPGGVASVGQAIGAVLGQGCNLREHGAGDFTADWRVEGDAAGNRWIEEAGFGRVLVVDEESRPIPIRAIPSLTDSGPALHGSRMVVHIGVRKGQHSGNADCLMRWCQADCYISPVQSDVRVWVSGLVGPPDLGAVRLCDSAAGTRFNMPTQEPRSRFGPATHGDCMHQLRVKDN